MSLRAARVTAAVAARTSVADRGGMAFTAGFYVAVTLALGTLWRTAAGVNGGSVAGYSAAALTWYVATTEAATISLNVRLIDEVGDDVRSGALGIALLRPAPLLVVRVATELGRALPRLGVCAAIGLVVATVFGGRPPDAVALLLAAPALLLAITANLVAMHAFAGIAFWLRETRATWFLYQKLVFVVGGMLLPLEVLPAGLTTVAKALPFMAMAYAPARLASGHREPWLLLVQAGWLVVLWLLATRVYEAGERRLLVAGA